HGFKDYCALLFFKGALLKDTQKILATPGALQSGRQLRFTCVKDIARLKPTIKAYIAEAIEIEKSGKKVKLKSTSDYEIPAEFKTALDKSAALRKAFQALTPGRQRGYIYHFSQPKFTATRIARVEKCIPAILAGKGLND
ncbi:MAG: YdeI/OmpD-associated family protein, partial [Acidobacteriota bacterium]|nr:YdeI/OmpD-associated family protein [Acidobacteriota bacterium]